MSIINKAVERYNKMSVALRAGFWFTICNFLQKGISFITIPIFTRIMSTEDYGTYSVYTSWYSIFTIFLTLNLSYYVFSKGMVKYEDDRDSFVVSLQSLNTAITLIFGVIYFLFCNHINQLLKLTTPLIVCMLVQILFEPTIAYWTARNRFEYRYRNVIIITLLLSVLNPVVGIILIKAELFDNAVFARAFSVSLITLCIGIFFYIQAGIRARRQFSTKYWKYALAFNIPLIPHFLSQTVLNQADRIMINSICNATDAALYSVAYSIGMAVTLFSQAIQQAFLPWLYQKLKGKDYAGIARITNVFLLVMVAICTIIIGMAPEIMLFVGSEKYTGASIVLPPICGSVFFIFLQNLFGNINYYFEETKKIAAASTGVALINIILNAIFIRQFGYVAAGYTTLSCYVAYAVFHYVVMRNVCRRNNLKVLFIIDIKAVAFISVAFLAFVVIINVLYDFLIIRYGIIIGIVLVVFFMRKNIVMYLTQIRNPN